MAVRVDIIEGATLSEGQDGYECARVFVVDGLSGDTTARLYEALNTSGIPTRGTPHPAIPTLVVADRQATSIRGSMSAVRVTLTYRNASGAEIADSGAPVMEIGGTVTSQTKHRDANGKMLFKSRTDLTLREDGTIAGAVTVYEVIEVEVQTPQVVVTYRRKTKRNPARDALKYVGKVGDWGRVDAYTAPWLFQRYDSKSEDGVTYDETLEFVFKPDGWCARVPRVVTATNALLAPPDLDIRDHLIPVYEAVSFDPLGLPPPPVDDVVDVMGDPAPPFIPLEQSA